MAGFHIYIELTKEFLFTNYNSFDSVKILVVGFRCYYSYKMLI